MTPEELFTAALGLGRQWRVAQCRFEGEPKCLELRLEHVAAERFACPKCQALYAVHDTIERRWRHMNFFQYRCELVAKVPRTWCRTDGVHQVQVPWTREGSGFTLTMEALIMLLSAEMPVDAMAELLDEHDTRLWRVLMHYVEQAHAINLVIGLPLNRFLLPAPVRHVAHRQEAKGRIGWRPHREMLLLAFVFAADWFVTGAVASHLPTLLERAGVTQFEAVAAAALVGPAQVAARIAEFVMLRRIHPVVSARIAASLHPIGAVVLFIVGPPAAAVFVLLYGVREILIWLWRDLSRFRALYP
jgi:Helix-turn-helix domain of transposase family ISL3/zinc-finger of transposase IS204/IS1001/IS1096/IS1165